MSSSEGSSEKSGERESSSEKESRDPVKAEAEGDGGLSLATDPVDVEASDVGMDSS